MRRLAFVLLLAGGAGAGDPERDALLAEIDREILSRKEEGRGDEALALEAEVLLLRRRAAEGGAAGPGDEVHLITAMKAFGSRPGEVRVKVTALDRPVVLVLASDPGVRWFVDKAPGVVLRRVYTAGSDVAVWVPGGSPLERLPDVEPRGPAAALEAGIEERLRCPVWTSLAPAGKEPVVVGPENPEWLAQHARTDARFVHWRSTAERRAAVREAQKEVRFGALRRWIDTSKKAPAHKVSFCEWTPLGPLLARQIDLPDPFGAATAAVRDDTRGDLYLLRHGVLLKYAIPSGPPEVLRVPDTLPEAKDSSALAIDTRRDRLLLATKHELGFLYALDLKSRRWSVIEDLDGVDAVGMAYDGQRDAILCVDYGEGDVLRIQRFSAEDGRHLREIPVRMPPLPGRGPLVAACARGNLVLLRPPAADAGRDAEDTRAFVVEPHTGQVILASRSRAWEDFAPLDTASLEDRWNALVARDEAAATRAMRAIAAQGDAAVAFLAPRLVPEPAEADDFRRWVKELADDDALVRGLAQQRLVEAGGRAGDFLATLDQRDLQPEARRRVGAALKAVGGAGLLQRNLRAVAILEWIGSPAAEKLLRELAAKGEAKRRAAAREALARLELPPR